MFLQAASTTALTSFQNVDLHKIYIFRDTDKGLRKYKTLNLSSGNLIDVIWQKKWSNCNIKFFKYTMYWNINHYFTERFTI